MRNLPLFNIFIAVTFFILGCYVHGCNCGSKGYESRTTDTVWKVVHDSTIVYAPKIDVIEGGHIPDKVDTPRVIKEYYEIPVYKDTVRVKYGFIRIYDTVTQNRIIARQIFADFDQPIITNTITIKEQQKTRGFLGVHGTWDMNQRILGVGPSLAVEFKNHQIIEGGITANTFGNVGVFFSAKFPISIKRK